MCTYLTTRNRCTSETWIYLHLSIKSITNSTHLHSKYIVDLDNLKSKQIFWLLLTRVSQFPALDSLVYFSNNNKLLSTNRTEFTMWSRFTIILRMDCGTNLKTIYFSIKCFFFLYWYQITKVQVIVVKNEFVNNIIFITIFSL